MSVRFISPGSVMISIDRPVSHSTVEFPWLRSAVRDILESRGSNVQSKWSHIRSRLSEVARDCSRQNWDGYGARPLHPEAVLTTRLVIDSLPKSTALPDVVPEPSGDVGLEWTDDKGSVFVVAFSGKNEVIYAGVLADGRKIHGTEPFVDELPQSVLRIVGGFKDPSATVGTR